MKYLLDANVWLEAIQGRQHAQTVEALLKSAPPGILAITDYSVHTIGLFLYRDHPELFEQFLDDVVQHRVNTLHLPPSALHRVLEMIAARALDFDDAFQYVAAERDNLQLVSLDADFDHTPRGRMTPAQVLAELVKP